MKHILVLLFAVGALFAEPINWGDDIEASLETSRTSKHPVLLFVYSSSCQYCGNYLEELARYEPYAKTTNRFVLVAQPKGSFTIAGKRFSTDITPSYYIYDEDGTLLGKPIHGYVEPHEFARYLNKIADMYSKYGKRSK